MKKLYKVLKTLDTHGMPLDGYISLPNLIIIFIEILNINL